MSSNFVPANNFPVVFSKQPPQRFKATQEKYRKPKLEKSKATFLSAFVFENISNPGVVQILHFLDVILGK